MALRILTMKRIRGRATQVLAKDIGKRPWGLSIPWPLVAISVTPDSVSLSTPIPGALGDDTIILQADVERVAAVGAIRTFLGFSVGLRCIDGTYWRYLLGPGPKVLDALEAAEWPVKRDVTSPEDETWRAARPMDE